MTGGRGNDIALLGDDDDTFVWNPGDGNDTVEGQGGFDTLQFNGSNAGERIDISANGGRVRFTRDIANITMDLDDVERINFKALGGADTITVNDLTGTDVQQVAIDLEANGGGGDAAADRVIVNGTNGVDQITVTLSGSTVLVNGLAAQVSITGQEGANDVLVINGLGGTDTLTFNGSNASENIQISANGGRARFVSDVANLTMDLDDVERIAFQALGGADNITVNDLSGTDVQQVAIDLQASGGGGDGQVDTVVASGSNAADTTTITQSGQDILVNGLSAAVSISGQEAGDRLQINGQGGDDIINASGLAAGRILLTLNGGLGDDVITGSAGNDLVNGGDGDDLALLGAGDDTFVWNPGDDNDIIEGQADFDTLEFNGANIAENIDISANGGRALFTRNIAAVTMDLNDVEQIAFRALGGADTITVNDLSGTDVQQVAIDLQATGGGGDGAADTVIVNGTNGVDQVTVTQSGGSILVNGLTAQVSIVGQEAANDRLTINGAGGADVIDASALGAGQIALTINGGAGNDRIIGSGGNDLFDGGADDDTFVFRPGGGADTIAGFQAGAGTEDRIDLKGFSGIHDLTAVLALATQVGADTVLNFGGGNTITLQGVTRADLDADDFLFRGPEVSSVVTSGAGITAGTGDINAGDVVVFTLTFDEAVIVAGGVPRLVLNDGGIAILTGRQRQQCADVPVHRGARPEHRRPRHYGGGPERRDAAQHARQRCRPFRRDRQSPGYAACRYDRAPCRPHRRNARQRRRAARYGDYLYGFL